MKDLNPQVLLKNGTTLSVQASEFHYCTPRTDDLKHWKDYCTVEVGFITDSAGQRVVPTENLWRQYADDGFPSDVYGFVPVRLVKDFISLRGGEVEA